MPIPLSRPPVDDEIKQAVIKAVESGQYILGPECKAFEKEFAAYNGAKHAVLTTSATAALWMIIKALGAKEGHEILVPAHTAFPTVAQAHGAAWQGRKAGSFGRAAAFSFYPSKNLTVMGDGGLVVTDDDAIAARCRQLRDHGRQNKDIHVEIGFNLRFNDLQAAVGRVLLRRLDAMNDRRRALAVRYAAGLGSLPLVLPSETPGARHVYHLYVARTSERDQLAAFLKERGIATGIHYPVACHQQPAVAYLRPGPLEHTERIIKQILTLPMSAGHTESEIDEVVAAVRAFFVK